MGTGGRLRRLYLWRNILFRKFTNALLHVHHRVPLQLQRLSLRDITVTGLLRGMNGRVGARQSYSVLR